MTATSRPAPAALLDLVAAAPDGAAVVGSGDGSVADVTDLTHDSRVAAPGVAFACRPGEHADGHDFAAGAVAAGSPALVVERALDLPVPQLLVPSVARALGPLAARVHGDPSGRMNVCGITGTNGKTTSAYLLESVLHTAGATTGLIGTVQTLIAGEAVAGVRTTPEGTDLQRLYRRMLDAGVTAAVMEVSSHGLALRRVDGTTFGVVIFTNLSQDHLDFHRDLEDYFAAKARLFTPAFAPVGVVNVDDPWGERLAREADVPVVGTSTRGAPADVVATEIESAPDGSTFTARLRGGAVRVRTSLPGDFNVANALGVLAAAEVVGVAPDVAAEGIARCTGVPGRMERVDAGQPFTVLVDYAHTPDSVTQLLATARRLADGARVLVVLGAGGDRDVGKRPLMGRAAAEGADLAVLTSDNPRSEDPLAILDAVRAGATSVPGAVVAVEPDRRSAIAVALADAAPGDIVVIAGKGHETTQEIAGAAHPFDDRAVVRELLAGVRS